MNGVLSKDQIEHSLSSVWDLGNETLYRLCRENFDHQYIGHYSFNRGIMTSEEIKRLYNAESL